MDEEKEKQSNIVENPKKSPHTVTNNENIKENSETLGEAEMDNEDTNKHLNVLSKSKENDEILNSTTTSTEDFHESKDTNSNSILQDNVHNNKIENNIEGSSENEQRNGIYSASENRNEVEIVADIEDTNVQEIVNLSVDSTMNTTINMTNTSKAFHKEENEIQQDPTCEKANLSPDIRCSISTLSTIANPELHHLLEQVLSDKLSDDELQSFDKKLSQLKRDSEKLPEIQKELLDEKAQHKSFIEKVDQWKVSVKEVSRKDLAKISKLQKELVQQVKENKNQWEQRYSPKNNHYDLLECIQIDETLWYLIDYHDKQLGKHWIDGKNISQDKLAMESGIPVKIQDRLKIEFEAVQDKLKNELEVIQKKYEETEASLQQYKSRALQALKKKTDSLNELKANYEKEFTAFENQISELKSKLEVSQRIVNDQTKQIAGLTAIEEKYLNLEKEFQQKSASLEELQISSAQQRENAKNVEQSFEKRIQELENNIAGLKNKYDNDCAQLESTIQTLNQEKEKLIESHHQIDAEKESKIKLLKKSYTEMKSKVKNLLEQQQSRRISSPIFTEIESSKSQSLSGISERSPQSTESSQSSPLSHSMNLESNNTVSAMKKEDKEVKLLKSIMNKETKNPFLMLNIPDDSPLARQIAEISQLYMEREAEIKDKMQYIDILKDSLAAKTNEVHQLILVEKELREHIGQIQETQRKGSPNIDYLRNVFLKYINSDDESIRSHSLTALGQILSLPKEEISKLQSKHSKSRLWFG